MKDEIKALNCQINKDIYEQLKAYCADNGTTIRFVVEKALSQYINPQPEKEKKTKGKSKNN